MRHDTQICILAVPDFRASLLENRVGARTGEMGRGGYIISKRTSKISKYRYIIGGGDLLLSVGDWKGNVQHKKGGWVLYELEFQHSLP